MLLRRITITWLTIAGIAAIAGVFVDGRYTVYRDRHAFGALEHRTEKWFPVLDHSMLE